MAELKRVKIRGTMRNAEKLDDEQLESTPRVTGDEGMPSSEEQDDSGREGVLSNVPESVADYIESKLSTNPTLQSQATAQTQSLQQSTPEELTKNLKDFLEAIDEHITQGNGLEDTSEEGEEQESQGQPEQAPDSPEMPQDEEEQQEGGNGGGKSCTDEERSFLDSFKKIQKAGKLLGMATTGSYIDGSGLRNTRVIPIVNQIKPSEKMFITEIQEEREVHEMFGEMVQEMLELADKMIESESKLELENQD